MPVRFNINLVIIFRSSFKVFEALKENVYLEVSALIAANESRPHFLIQLFRDLQLISSDPLRHRALHSIQELYNRNFEANIQEGGPSQSIQVFFFVFII